MFLHGLKRRLEFLIKMLNTFNNRKKLILFNPIQS